METAYIRSHFDCLCTSFCSKFCQCTVGHRPSRTQKARICLQDSFMIWIYKATKKDTQTQRKAKTVRPKSSRPPTWRKRRWNFLVERFLLNIRFPAASYETAEENKKLFCGPSVFDGSQHLGGSPVQDSRILVRDILVERFLLNQVPRSLVKSGLYVCICPEFEPL